jgi:hypothetical protein
VANSEESKKKRVRREIPRNKRLLGNVNEALCLELNYLPSMEA